MQTINKIYEQLVMSKDRTITINSQTKTIALYITARVRTKYTEQIKIHTKMASDFDMLNKTISYEYNSEAKTLTLKLLERKPPISYQVL